MTKFRIWLCTKFLPAWCKEELLDENKRLVRLTKEQQQEIKRLRAYIDGMNNALRRQPKICIGEMKHE